MNQSDFGLINNIISMNTFFQPGDTVICEVDKQLLQESN